MPRVLNRLSDRAVRTAEGPIRLADGGGLYLVVDGSGARRWLFRYRRSGREREAGFGGYPTISLGDARKKRDEARALLANGTDPIDQKRQSARTAGDPITFGQFSDRLIPELCKGFRNVKHAAQWSATLNTYAASLRQRPLADIATQDILDVLQPIWMAKSETASRLRGRIERVLDAAKAKGLRLGENPARWRGHLDQVLPQLRKLSARGHHKALPYAEMPAFIARRWR
jgi:hypothetical protein